MCAFAIMHSGLSLTILVPEGSVIRTDTHKDTISDNCKTASEGLSRKPEKQRRSRSELSADTATSGPSKFISGWNVRVLVGTDNLTR